MATPFGDKLWDPVWHSLPGPLGTSLGGSLLRTAPKTFLCRSSTSSPLKTQNNAVNVRRECAGSYVPTLPLYKPSLERGRYRITIDSGARSCQWIFRLYIFPLFSGRVRTSPRYSAREWYFRFYPPPMGVKILLLKE